MGKNILVIDDDESALEIVEEVLKYADFNVKGIQQTTDVFKIIEDFKPDLVVMDYILRGVNGGELCHLIKTDERTAHLPVVLISAYPRVLESLGRYGCDAFIAKPFDINDLISCVNECLHIAV